MRRHQAFLKEYIYGRRNDIHTSGKQSMTDSSQHGIMSIPTMMIFKNGELVDRLVGALPKPAIMEKLQPHF